MKNETFATEVSFEFVGREGECIRLRESRDHPDPEASRAKCLPTSRLPVFMDGGFGETQRIFRGYAPVTRPVTFRGRDLFKMEIK